jgi:hypothetical protein
MRLHAFRSEAMDLDELEIDLVTSDDVQLTYGSLRDTSNGEIIAIVDEDMHWWVHFEGKPIGPFSDVTIYP